MEPIYISIESDRLLLRPLEIKDLHDFHAYRSIPEVAKYQGYEPFNEKQALEFIEAQQDKKFGVPGEWMQLAIIDKNTMKLIGDAAVRLLKDDPQTGEIGCTISPEYQGNGYARETLLAIMNFLFESINVRRIVEITDADNAASIRLMESIGFRKEGHFIDNIWFKGKWGSELQYALLASEWPAVKKKNPERKSA